VLPTFGSRPGDDRAAGGGFVQNLTFEDLAILEREMEDVATRGIRHRIEPHDRRPSDHLHGVTDTPEIAVSTVEAADAAERLAIRHKRHIPRKRVQRMLRTTTVSAVVIIAVFFTAFLSGQMRQGPASLDDVVHELRGIRADLAETSSASVRSQLLVARLQLQGQRIDGLLRQLYDVQSQLGAARQQAQGAERDRMMQLIQELGNREAELTHQVSVEQGRWAEFSDRLDVIERSLPR
jgi:hypothetical protein